MIPRVIAAITLIETVIALTLSTITMLGLHRFIGEQIRENNTLKKRIFLQHESQALMQMMRHHISHLNFIGKPRDHSNIHLFAEQGKNYAFFDDCFMFFYDANNDGCLGKRRGRHACTNGKHNATTKSKHDPKEIFGFKQQAYELKVLEDADILSCRALDCSQLLKSCAKGKWGLATKNTIYQVTELRIKPISPALISLSLTLGKDNISYTNYAQIYIPNH